MAEDKVSKKRAQKKYIKNAMNVFEALEHTVMLSKKGDLWDFTTYYQEEDKYYAVWCTGSIESQKSLIQVAKRQLDSNNIRLVVVCLTMTDEDEAHSNDMGYCLCNLKKLLQFGNDMLEIQKLKDGGAVKDENLGKVIVLDD